MCSGRLTNNTCVVFKYTVCARHTSVFYLFSLWLSPPPQRLHPSPDPTGFGGQKAFHSTEQKDIKNAPQQLLTAPQRAEGCPFFLRPRTILFTFLVYGTSLRCGHFCCRTKIRTCCWSTFDVWFHVFRWVDPIAEVLACVLSSEFRQIFFNVPRSVGAPVALFHWKNTFVWVKVLKLLYDLYSTAKEFVVLFRTITVLIRSLSRVGSFFRIQKCRSRLLAHSPPYFLLSRVVLTRCSISHRLIHFSYVPWGVRII